MSYKKQAGKIDAPGTGTHKAPSAIVAANAKEDKTI
jgi:hypothetical protein